METAKGLMCLGTVVSAMALPSTLYLATPPVNSAVFESSVCSFTLHLEYPK